MTNGNIDKTKNEAAVLLGRLGGKRKLQIHGVEEFKRMSQKAALVRIAKKQMREKATTLPHTCPKNGLKYLTLGKCPCYEKN